MQDGAPETDDVDESATAAASARPFVSVVIPVYEDVEGLTVTVRSLAEQTYPDDRHEVVIVDNGSADRTPAVAASLADEHETVRTIVEEKSGSYAARNAGIRATDGAVVSFVDADMTVERDWLERVVDRLQSTKTAYLACDVELEATAGETSVAERYNRRTAFPIEQYVNSWGFAPTCCLTVRRRLLDDVGLFDEELCSSGDKEFGNRVAAAGYDLVFAADITMSHPPRTTTRALVSKSVRIGRGSYQLSRRYPNRYGGRLRRVANPLAYTPPLPSSMRQYVSGWEDLSWDEQGRFFLLAWLLTLAKAYGKLSEAVTDLRTPETPGSPPVGRGVRTGNE